jgi:hypothetical protein
MVSNKLETSAFELVVTYVIILGGLLGSLGLVLYFLVAAAGG